MATATARFCRGAPGSTATTGPAATRSGWTVFRPWTSTTGTIVVSEGTELFYGIHTAIGGQGRHPSSAAARPRTVVGVAAQRVSFFGVSGTTLSYAKSSHGVIVDTTVGLTFDGTVNDAFYTVGVFIGSDAADKFISSAGTHAYYGGAGVDTISYENLATGHLRCAWPRR